MPSRRFRNRNHHWNSASSETPVTISGVTSDKYSDPASHADARFHSAYAASVPIAVANAVAMIAMMRLLAADSRRSRSAKAARYQLSENPSQIVKREELKLNTARISSGTCRNAY